MGAVCSWRAPDGEVEDGGLAHAGWVNCAGGRKVESRSMSRQRQPERRRERRRQPPSGAMESRSGIALDASNANHRNVAMPLERTATEEAASLEAPELAAVPGAWPLD